MDRLSSFDPVATARRAARIDAAQDARLAAAAMGAEARWRAARRRDDADAAARAVLESATIASHMMQVHPHCMLAPEAEMAL